MENRNNALHYKMYKSGKNIVYAGLATTAVLAGLTLANANNTADAATTTTTDAASPVAQVVSKNAAATPASTAATSAEIQSQQAVVNSASADVQSQQAVVNTNKANLESANQLNSGVAAVSAAESAYNQAASNYYKASAAVGPVSKASQDAKSALNAAQDWQNYFDNGGNDKYNDMTSQIAKAQKLLDAANAQSASTSAAASDALVNANSASDALSADPTNSDLRDAYDSAMQNLSLANEADQNVKNTIRTQKALIKSLNDKLAGKVALADGNTVNFNYGKKVIAQLPELQSAFDKAHQAYLDAVDAKNTANDLAQSKYQAWMDAQVANNLMQPGTEAYEKLSHNAWQAKNEINTLKANPKVTAVKDAEQNVKADEGVLANKKTALDAAQKHLDNVVATQTQLQQKLADAKKADPNDDLGLVSAAQSALDQWTNSQVTPAKRALQSAKTAVQNAEKGLQWRKDLLAKAQNDPEYIKLSAQIQKDQSYIDAWAQLQDNLKNASSVAATLQSLQDEYNNSVKLLNELQTKLTNEQNKLAAMEGQTSGSNSNAGSNSNSNANSGSNSNSNANSGANSGAASDANSNANSGANAGNNATSGAQSGAAASAAHKDVAANAAAKVAVNEHVTRTAYRAQHSNNASANALPQTGNENTAAVVALGAVSAMFGLGLAAKKREF